MSKRSVTLAVLLLLVGCIWWLVQVDKEIGKIDIVPDEMNSVPSLVPSSEETPDNWDIERSDAFFIEYRLQRDRVRADEVEKLNGILDNDNVSADGKKNAEEQLLQIIQTMEKELLVENLLKAQGYKDAIFFSRDGLANVVVQSDKLSDKEFMQITEMVSSVAGIKMEDVVVVEHQEP